MLRLTQMLNLLLVSESGADLAEYAVLAAFVAVLTLAALGDFGEKHVRKLYLTLCLALKNAWK